MKTCETCRHLETEEITSNLHCHEVAKSLPVPNSYFLYVSKDFGCIHHEEKKEPEVTVEEAINWLKDWRKWNIRAAQKETQSSKYVGIAIRALEEMREREKLSNVKKTAIERILMEIPDILFKIPDEEKVKEYIEKMKPKPETATGVLVKEWEKIKYPHPNDPKVMEYIKNLQKPKPRTWRGANVGELYDKLEKNGWTDSAAELKETAKAFT